MAWYNSDFGHFSGWALLSLGIGLGIGGYEYLSKVPKEVPQNIPVQSADLNGNNNPEKFYTIDNCVAVIEVDGEPILDFLKKH